jgi:hypothetical protein
MISKVGHWNLDKHTTYIRVFRATRASHILPYDVPDLLIMGEIFYWTILQGYNTTLVKDKKQALIPYNFHVGFYLVKETAQARQEGMSQLEFRFLTGQFRKHDPKGLFLQHASKFFSCWPYAHDKFEDEIFTKCAQNWDEVVQRKSKTRMNKFKAMSMDE